MLGDRSRRSLASDHPAGVTAIALLDVPVSPAAVHAGCCCLRLLQAPDPTGHCDLAPHIGHTVTPAKPARTSRGPIDIARMAAVIGLAGYQPLLACVQQPLLGVVWEGSHRLSSLFQHARSYWCQVDFISSPLAELYGAPKWASAARTRSAALTSRLCCRGPP